MTDRTNTTHEYDRRKVILEGVRDGIPIGLGYFVVAFSLGIAAKIAGLTPLEGFVASLLNNASAGEYAAFTLMAANASYIEMAVVTLITNARYLLMSTALSQRIPTETGVAGRIAAGFCITDEIFALGIGYAGKLSLVYLGSAFILADLMWSAGTTAGIIAGNILPANVVSALSVAIYGMFLAIIMPPARENKVIAGLVAAAFAKVIVLTVALSAATAVLFPVPEEKEGGKARE